ncbi:hypothetical protein [Aneurinibacillus danicus]|uniref:Uncharacterized protein n=1 Tax=Aneurinibacillus danicus TaxID=267746 RepID=A0A511V223_9BACL|nr:hypothetical protein [Aneurinibacillus danicus]GEN32944.1 hypothetical protein ADA01nite_04040 [Aneurinibacillus danicus]
MNQKAGFWLRVLALTIDEIILVLQISKTIKKQLGYNLPSCSLYHFLLRIKNRDIMIGFFGNLI